MNVHSLASAKAPVLDTPKVERHDFLASIGRETLRERVYSALRRSLMHGAFEAGEVLRIVELAQRLQTSAMPVREGIGRLVSEQALEAMPNRSVRVPLISRERLNDLTRARCLVEGELVELALPNLGDADYAVLRSHTSACEAAFAGGAANRAHVAAGLNHAFHFHIYQAAGSAVLVPVAESLWLQSGPYVRAAAQTHNEATDQPAFKYHWTLIEALARRDTSAAVRALNSDITQSFNVIRAHLDEDAEA